MSQDDQEEGGEKPTVPENVCVFAHTQTRRTTGKKKPQEKATVPLVNQQGIVGHDLTGKSVQLSPHFNDIFVSVGG